MLTSLCDKNLLHVNYLQPKFTKVSTECATDSRKNADIKND